MLCELVFHYDLSIKPNKSLTDKSKLMREKYTRLENNNNNMKGFLGLPSCSQTPQKFQYTLNLEPTLF
jgi:hypothetical protein